MFKDHHPKEKLAKMKHESVEAALARGVKIEKIGANTSGKKPNKSDTKIDHNLLPKDIMELLKK
jgi:hypothetical protein